MSHSFETIPTTGEAGSISATPSISQANMREPFKRSRERGSLDIANRPRLYNVACAHAMMGNRDAAFEWLEKAVDAGFNLEGYILADEDLNNLRSDPRFKRFSRMVDDEHKLKEKNKE